MTVTVKVSVNGRYNAFVKRNDETEVCVKGNYDENTGEMSFNLPHGKETIFVIREEQVEGG